MKIAFIAFNLKLRGTTTAIYDYADCAEKILLHESVVIVLDDPVNHKKAVARFRTRFGANLHVVSGLKEGEEVARHCDAVYVLCEGKPMSLDVAPARVLVHAVFDGSEPWGDRFAVVSHFLATKYKAVCVPHVVRPTPHTSSSLRAQLGIKHDAVVFGYFGSIELFSNIGLFACQVVARERPTCHFVFVFSEDMDPEALKSIQTSPNIHVLSPMSDLDEINMFVHTLDAGIECNVMGRTFGLSIAQICAAGRPVICNNLPNDANRAHLDILGDTAILYDTNYELVWLLMTYERSYEHAKYSMPYYEYLPSFVMRTFKEVFLDDNVPKS